jgi:hypothetical protein
MRRSTVAFGFAFAAFILAIAGGGPPEATIGLDPTLVPTQRAIIVRSPELEQLGR